jgi:uncharacterized protein
LGQGGTGKSTLLKQLFGEKNAIWIDLLDPSEEDLFIREPSELLRRIEGANDAEWVVIDEVQKAPKLLNLVHKQIEESDIKFALTGSSARRLKQKGVNLLAGRAFTNNLFPFTSLELKSDFSLQDALEWGTLPTMSSLDSNVEKAEYLRSYALNYLKLEIQAEQWVRKIEPFRKALPIIAQMNGKIINYSRIAKDVGVDTTTVQNYYEILEDTLMGFKLAPFHQSIRKRQQKSPKFYLFDPGIKRALDRTLNIPLSDRTYSFGEAFEHFMICEAIRLNEYFRKDFEFSYLRTKDDLEVDLIIDRPGLPTAFVEIKSTEEVTEKSINKLNGIVRDAPNATGFFISRDKHKKVISGIEVLPWQLAFEELGFY